MESGSSLVIKEKFRGGMGLDKKFAIFVVEKYPDDFFASTTQFLGESIKNVCPCVTMSHDVSINRDLTTMSPLYFGGRSNNFTYQIRLPFGKDTYTGLPFSHYLHQFYIYI